jgi:hypothetical protein
MIRRFVIGPGAIAALVLGSVIGLSPAQAAPRGSACVLSGSATISPGLTQTAKTQAITLKGVKLANCRAGSSTAPNTKTFSATVTTSPNPVYAKASCASGNLVLSATITWNNGQTTTASIKTTGVTANQAISGKVTGGTNPTLKAGDLVEGDVAFQPTTTGQNCVAKPVVAVTFQGTLAAGSPS